MSSDLALPGKYGHAERDGAICSTTYARGAICNVPLRLLIGGSKNKPIEVLRSCTRGSSCLTKRTRMIVLRKCDTWAQVTYSSSYFASFSQICTNNIYVYNMIIFVERRVQKISTVAFSLVLFSSDRNSVFVAMVTTWPLWLVRLVVFVGLLFSLWLEHGIGHIADQG